MVWAGLVFQEYEYGDVPLVTVTVAVPLHWPLQVALDCAVVKLIFEQLGIPAREFMIRKFPLPSTTRIGKVPGGVAVVEVE